MSFKTIPVISSVQVRTVEVIERSSMKPKIDVKDLFAGASANSNANGGQPQPGVSEPDTSEEFTRLLRGNCGYRITHWNSTCNRRLMLSSRFPRLNVSLVPFAGLEANNLAKRPSEVPPKSIQAARDEQSEALKKMLNISGSEAQTVAVPAPSSPRHKSENVLALENYIVNHLQLATKADFKVVPGEKPGTHIASVTVDTGDADGPLNLSSEPKMTPEFAIDVVSSIALQTLQIKTMIKQMGGAGSPVGDAVAEEERSITAAAARLLPSPGSAFTAVTSPQQQHQQQHSLTMAPPAEQPLLPMRMMMPNQNVQMPSANPLLALGIPPRMMPPAMQHGFNRPPPHVIPHMSMLATPNALFQHPSPMGQPGQPLPGAYPGSHPANAGGMTLPLMDGSSSSPVYHHVAQLPVEETSGERRLSKSSIPPAFVPLQVHRFDMTCTTHTIMRNFA